MTSSRTGPGTCWALFLALVAVLLAGTARSDAASTSDQPTLENRVNAALGLRDSRLTLITPTSEPGEPMIVLVPIDDVIRAIALDPHRIRSDRYELLAQQADGRLHEIDPGVERTLRGSVLDLPDSQVAGSLLEDGLHLRVALGEGSVYWIEPIGSRFRDADPDLYVVYDEADVIETDKACGLDDLPDARAHAGFVPTRGGDGDRGVLQVAELACDADYEYFLHYGSVNAVQSRIASIVNTVNAQYESEVGITHEITTIIVRTAEPDPYSSTDASTLLNQFRNDWNAHHGNIQRDIAHMFTGKELNGGTIGIAWVGVVCNLSYGYGLVQSDFNGNYACATDLSAHELGHGWNADHCSCPSYTMNPYITCANRFSPTLTIPEIVSFRNSRNCLDDGSPPDPVGACCTGTACSVVSETDCTSGGGTWLGEGTDCSPDPCAPIGACCVGGTCGDATESECSANGGMWLGEGTACLDDPCSSPDPTGACCLDGSCSIQIQFDCLNAGGVWQGEGTDCSGDPCGGGGGDVVNLATADFETLSGTITSGSYLSTHTEDDVYEVLREAHTGGRPTLRRSILQHTWTFNVASGSSYTFFVGAHHEENTEGDDFVFLYSLDNQSFSPMLTVTKTADDDVLQSFAFPEDIAGTVYVRVEDTDREIGNGSEDAVFVDLMYILTGDGGGDVTPPSAPTNLTATAGDGSVSLNWDDNSEPDLDGYFVYRGTNSGGPYTALNMSPVSQSDYVDDTAVNGTTYFYVVTAVDLDGNISAESNEAIAQPPGGDPTTMHVSVIIVSIENMGAGEKRGRADVTVVDNFGNPVAGATVFGTFSGDFNESRTADTNSNGVAILRTVGSARGGISLTFCVDNVVYDSLIYDESENVVTCESR